MRSRLSTFQEFGHRAGEPARSRPLEDQFESIQGTGQVEWVDAVKRVDVYLRDQRFEFAASHIINLCTLLCVLCACYLNKLLHFARRFNVFVDFVHQHRDLIGVGKPEPRRANSISMRVPRKELILVENPALDLKTGAKGKLSKEPTAAFCANNRTKVGRFRTLFKRTLYHTHSKTLSYHWLIVKVEKGGWPPIHSTERTL